MIFDNLLLATLMLEDLQLQSYKSSHLNPLNANPTKWSNTQFINIFVLPSFFAYASVRRMKYPRKCINLPR